MPPLYPGKRGTNFNTRVHHLTKKIEPGWCLMNGSRFHHNDAYQKHPTTTKQNKKKTVSEVNRFFYHNLPHKFRIQEWITTPSQHHCWRHGPKTKTGHHWSRVHHWPCQVNQVVHGKVPNLVDSWRLCGQDDDDSSLPGPPPDGWRYDAGPLET